MRAGLLGSLVAAASLPGHAASLRNVYFSNGQLVPGQRYRSEGQLPGPVTTFVKGQDKTARLFIVFGDLEAHRIEGELKGPDGKVVRRVDRTVEALHAVAQWRVSTVGFDVAPLNPGEYTFDLRIDGESKGAHTFSLKAAD
jgi:hypothetical protein